MKNFNNLKSATNSHADYYCSLDTLFDDSLATSDVIIFFNLEKSAPVTRRSDRSNAFSYANLKMQNVIKHIFLTEKNKMASKYTY